MSDPTLRAIDAKLDALASLFTAHLVGPPPAPGERAKPGLIPRLDHVEVVTAQLAGEVAELQARPAAAAAEARAAWPAWLGALGGAAGGVAAIWSIIPHK